MAFDGITIAALCAELNGTLTDGSIAKIVQPSADTVVLDVRCGKTMRHLFLCASASLPLLYLTEEKYQAPMAAPSFTMLLRKHLLNGRIRAVTQPGLERAVRISISHRNEMGDLTERVLVLEIMGKHSNLILLDENETILDSIKHVPPQMSSVRTVLPGREYFLPSQSDKLNPLACSEDEILSTLKASSVSAGRALAAHFTGISTFTSEQIAARSLADPSVCCADLPSEDLASLCSCFAAGLEDVRRGHFTPSVLYDKERPVEFGVLPLTVPQGMQIRPYSSVSGLLAAYYSEKQRYSAMREKTASLRHILKTAESRAARKLSLQEKQLSDTDKADRYRLFGELLLTYAHTVPGGADKAEFLNYYTNETVTVPLKKEISATDNARQYFDRYQKLKRTKESVTEQIEKTRSEVRYLSEVLELLDFAENESDLAQIRRELADEGYVKKVRTGKKGPKEEKLRPMHYRTADGFDLYVGKNNLQNEYVTFKIAAPSDWWFHANDIPGSHVVIKGDGREIPDSVFEAAGRLAAHYSKAGSAPKVEVDYTLRRNLKKTAGGAPGFVIYHTNYSMMADTDISDLTRLG